MPQQVCKACIGKLNYCTTFENSSRKAREMLCKIKPKPMKSVTIKTEPKEYEETTYCQRPEAVFIQETDINTKPNVQDIKMEIFDEEVEIKTDPDFYPAPEDITRTEQIINKPNTSHTAITSSNMAEFDLTRCGICKLHFSRYNLAWHIKKKHRSLCIPDELGDQNSHSTQCDICEKIFPKQKLWNHLKLTHKLGWIRREGHVVKCPLCPLEVSVPGILFHLNYCHGIQCKSTGAVENGMMSLEKLSAQLAPPAQNVAQHNAPTKQKIASHIKIQESLSKEKEEEFTMVYCVICERFMAETSFWFHMKAMHDLGWLEKDGDVIKCPLCPVKFEEKEVLTHLESCHDIQIKPGLKNKSMTLRELRLQCAPKPPVPLKPDAPSPWVNCVHCKVAIENMPHRMEYHITIKHPGGKELLCNICDENFLHTGMEQPHMYSKNKKKCPHYKCFRVFNTTEEMEFHVEHDHKKNIVPIKPKPVRTITVPYTPKKVYANKKALRLLGDQVQCDICLQIIRNADRLITHKNSRHGMNLKFHCDICGRGYPTARTVRRHKQRVQRKKHVLYAENNSTMGFFGDM
ncbi:hypothetical protein B566_EDAN008548 [Ephemera danica]|nr:hypothetical protein B566_EDAN008548 [Ephemera danica]